MYHETIIMEPCEPQTCVPKPRNFANIIIPEGFEGTTEDWGF
jgi:hypothetical protein